MMVEGGKDAGSVVVKGGSLMRLRVIEQASILSMADSSRHWMKTPNRYSHWLIPPRVSCFLCTRPSQGAPTMPYEASLVWLVPQMRENVSQGFVAE